MNDQQFRPRQWVTRLADGQRMRCLNEVEGEPGRYLCAWDEDGTKREGTYDHAELKPFEFKYVIGINANLPDR